MPGEFYTSTLLHEVQERAPQPVPRVSINSKLKRSFDVIFAALLIALLLPLMALIGVLIWLGSGGPILFRQQRVGMGGRPFLCLKFRTMAPNADQILRDLLERSPEARKEWEQNFKLKNDPRITSIGKFLRKTSLDELPQLFNVLVGDMSLVGPRPVVAAELPKYGSVLPLYFSVRPGLTGLWQINGRSDCSYSERVAFDEKYVRTWSFRKDLVIILRTLEVVLSGKGSC